jgi:hypothetical protein
VYVVVHTLLSVHRHAYGFRLTRWLSMLKCTKLVCRNGKVFVPTRIC